MPIRETFSNSISFGSDRRIWQRLCDEHFNSSWAHSPCCLSKGPLKRDFLEIYVTTFSESIILEIQKLLGSSFFSEWSKFNLDFINAGKNWENLFCFWDNCIWIAIVRLSLLRTGYFSSAAKVLTSSPMIWHVNKKEFLEYNFPASDQWIWSGCCDAGFNSVWARLPCCSWEGSIKRDFLDIYLTMFSESLTSKIHTLWGSSFSSKCLKFNLDFKNAAKTEETYFVSEIIASELGSLNCLY